MTTAPAAAPIASRAAAVRLNVSRFTAACRLPSRVPSLSSLLHRSAAARSAALLPAVVRILGEALLDDAIEAGRNAVAKRRQRLRIVRQDGRHEARATASCERRPAGAHLVENHPQRKDVRARIRVAAFDLLRRHIRDGAEHRALLGQFEAVRGSLDGLLAARGPAACASPKSRSFTPPPASITLLGFRSRCTTPFLWAASRASAMSPASATCTIDGNRTALQTFGERLSLEQLHDEKRHAVDFADVVNGADVRVGDPGDRSRFALKSFQLQAPSRARDDVRILIATDRSSCESRAQ